MSHPAVTVASFCPSLVAVGRMPRTGRGEDPDVNETLPGLARRLVGTSGASGMI